MSNNQIFYQPSNILIGSNDRFYDVFWYGGKNHIVAISSFKDHNENYRITKIDGIKSNIIGTVIPDQHRHTLIVLFKDLPNITITNICISNSGNWSQLYVLSPRLHTTSIDNYCISTIIKNESKYIVPWVDYHVQLGFNKIFIYDNGSSDRNILIEKLKSWIDAHIVHLIDWSFPYILPKSGISGQTTQQNHSIYRLGKVCKWLALIDVDEFIVPIKHNKIVDMLKPFETMNICAVSLECVWFGCNGMKQIDENNYLHQMTKRKTTSEGPYKRQKCIVIPSKIDVFSVHMVVSSKAPTHYVNPWEVAHFNHYIMLSHSAQRKCDHQIYDNVSDTRIIELIKNAI